MRDFKNYKIWIESQNCIAQVYKVSSGFPNDEKYNITGQLRRAANSVAANFAEGCSRSSAKDFNRFLEISLGSVYECQSFLISANTLGFISEQDFQDLSNSYNRIAKMIWGLMKSLKRS